MPQLPLRFGDTPNSPPPSINGRWFYPYVRVSCASIDIKATAEGRYSGYFLSGSGSGSHHVFECAAVHPVLGLDASGDTHAYGRWIIGTLGSTKVSANFSAAIAIATATGSGSSSSNSFKAMVRGIDDAKWEKLRLLSGKLDANSIRNLGGAMAEPLEWCLSEEQTKRSPAAIFQVRRAEYDIGDSCIFALNRIKRGSDFDRCGSFLDDALSSAKTRPAHRRIDLLTVRAMYHRFGIVDGPPSESQQKLAEDVLKQKQNLPSVNKTVRGFWYSLPPYSTSVGTAPGLEHVTTAAKRVAVNSWPNTTLGSSSAGKTGSYEVEIETALRLGISSIVDISAKVDARFYGYGFDTNYVCAPAAGSLFLQERYSAGFRVRVRSTGEDVSLDVPAIAAKGTLAATEVSYEIEALGIDISALKDLPAFVTSCVGKFDVTTLNALGLIYQQASGVLNGDSPALRPVLTAVEINLGTDEVQALTDVGSVRIAELLGNHGVSILAASGDSTDAPLLLGD